MSEPSAAEVSAIERALGRDRAIVLGALVSVVVLCWAWIVPMARDMSGAMTGASAWMTTERWDLPHVALLFAMWTVMMAGMMLPSAAPTLLLYTNVVRKSTEGAHAPRRAYLFAAGYLVVWTAFSAVAAVLQWALISLFVLSPMMALESRLAAAALLVAAGAYQVTPFKRHCLVVCRSPATFIVGAWRPGNAGAFHMGVAHGFFCLGCCWMLMLLLFAGGIMNLVVIGALTAFVLIEKLAPIGVQGGRLSGVLMVATGLVWLLR